MVEQVLVVLRVAFVVLLYLVVWRIVRLSVRDVRTGQESMILAPAGGVATSRPAAVAGPGQLVVTKSPAFPAGTVVLCDDTVVFGRGPEADAVLEGDDFASGRHARVFRKGDDVYVEDLGSTNGTFVNGQRLAAERRLRPGDVLIVGGTELAYRAAGAA
jgi:pSer/pThr/pTyr-binding forkhead associated (FHA) protein